MNKAIKDTFNRIKIAEACYRDAVKAALLGYRKDMEKATAESKQFKDEGGYINSKKATARNQAQLAINSAANGLVDILKYEVDSLRDDLHQHLTTQPNTAFLDALRLYYDFDLQPSHAELEALMTLNGGNTLGYRAINRTLEKTGAEWRIDAPDSAAYEADLAVLQKLACGNFLCTPAGFHHEMVEVYGGTPHLRMRDDGSLYDAGYKWDSTSILQANADYAERTGAIAAMADRWSRTVLPNIKRIAAYTDNEETGETAAQQLASDIKATAHAPGIERAEQTAVEQARKLGKEQAAGLAGAAAAIEHFKV